MALEWKASASWRSDQFPITGHPFGPGGRWRRRWSVRTDGKTERYTTKSPRGIKAISTIATWEGEGGEQSPNILTSPYTCWRVCSASQSTDTHISSKALSLSLLVTPGTLNFSSPAAAATIGGMFMGGMRSCCIFPSVTPIRTPSGSGTLLNDMPEAGGKRCGCHFQSHGPVAW